MDIVELSKMKGVCPIVCLTAYTAPMGRLLDRHADILLVGDSLGMVVYGLENTLGVTMDMMINHGSAVVRSSASSIVIIDMPFGSFESSPALAYENALRLVNETGAHGVKLEGGAEMSATISYLCERGIFVMGHVGLMPQHFSSKSGFRLQGFDSAGRVKILSDAMAVEKAGVFSLVIEHTVSEVAAEISSVLSIPLIGIGAGPHCDGQILVCDDLLGLACGGVPGFVKQYADLNLVIDSAVASFAREVRESRFPEEAHYVKASDINSGH